MQGDLLPSSQRSLDEVCQTAYISDVLGIGIYDAMKKGDQWIRSDAAFDLADDLVLIYEHDPLYWHTDEMRDCEKTKKLLNYENTLVVRARIGATELPIQHERLIQLVVPEKIKHEDLMYEFAQAVHSRVPEPYRTRLRNVEKTKKKDVEAYASRVFAHIHPDYETKLRERQTFLDEHGLDLKASGFVGLPLQTMKDTLECLFSFGLTKAKIASHPNLLSYNSESLRDNFSVLENEFGFTKAKIASNPSLLWCKPNTLRDKFSFLENELGLTKAKIASNPTLLTMKPNTLRDKFSFLENELGLTKAKIASNPTLVTMKPETLRNKFSFLENDLGLTKAKIGTQPPLLWNETLRETGVWLRHRGFDWSKNPALLLSSLPRMQASFDFFVEEGVPEHLIKVHHVQRITETQKKRKHSHVGYSAMDGPSKLRVLCTR